MLAFFRLIRFYNLLIIALGLSLFYYFLIVPNHEFQLGTKLLPFTKIDFVLFVLSIVFVAAAGNIINDYFDFELDKEYKPERPLAKGAFSLDTAMYMHAAFALAGIGLGFYLGWGYNYFKIGYMYIMAVLLLYLYSSYLKKIALVGNVVIAALTGFVFVLLMMFEVNFLNTVHFDFAERIVNILKQAVVFYGGFAFLTNLAREIVKDLEDREGDEAFNIQTLPVQYGDNFAKAVAALVMFALIGGVGYFMKGFWDMHAMKEFFYLLSLIVFPTFAAIVLLIIAKDRKQYALVNLLLKAIMLFGILSIPAFYYFTK